MKNFGSLEQRVINMYIDLFPSFKPVKNDEISEISQRQFYDFIKMIITTITKIRCFYFQKQTKTIILHGGIIKAWIIKRQLILKCEKSEKHYGSFFNVYLILV